MKESQDLTLLFLPGAGGTASKWRRVKERAGAYRSVFADLPAHGSNQDPVLRSIEQHAEYFRERITEKTVVIGHSMGGLIGIELAAGHPQVVGLVLAASHYRLPVDRKLFDKLDAGVYPDGLFYASYSKKTDPALLEEERRELNRVSLETTTADYRCCDAYTNGKDRLSKLGKPVLAIYGAEDRMLPKAAIDEMRAVVPQAEVEVIPGAGHFVMLERADRFAESLFAFVRKLSDEE